MGFFGRMTLIKKSRGQVINIFWYNSFSFKIYRRLYVSISLLAYIIYASVSNPINELKSELRKIKVLDDLKNWDLLRS